MEKLSNGIGTNGNYAADYPYQPRPAGILLGVEAETVDSSAKWASPQVIALALLLFFCFAASDVGIAPLMWNFRQNDWGAMLVYIAMGAILAQAGLLTCGAVFGPGAYWKRLTCFWLGAAMFFVLWAVGFAIVLAERAPNTAIKAEIFLTVLFAPLAALAIQSPLWLFRVYQSWRIVRCDRVGQEKALAIRDYFVGTAMVACSIGLARQGKPPYFSNEQFWAAWGIAVVIMVSLCFVSVIPAVLLMFRCDWQFGLSAFVSYAAIVPTALVVVAYYFFASPIGPLSWHSIGLLLVFVSFAVFLALGLKAIRDAGFCLVTRKIYRAAN